MDLIILIIVVVVILALAIYAIQNVPLIEGPFKSIIIVLVVLLGIVFIAHRAGVF